MFSSTSSLFPPAKKRNNSQDGPQPRDGRKELMLNFQEDEKPREEPSPGKRMYVLFDFKRPPVGKCFFG